MKRNLIEIWENDRQFRIEIIKQKEYKDREEEIDCEVNMNGNEGEEKIEKIRFKERKSIITMPKSMERDITKMRNKIIQILEASRKMKLPKLSH